MEDTSTTFDQLLLGNPIAKTREFSLYELKKVMYLAKITERMAVVYRINCDYEKFVADTRLYWISDLANFVDSRCSSLPEGYIVSDRKKQWKGFTYHGDISIAGHICDTYSVRRTGATR